MNDAQQVPATYRCWWQDFTGWREACGDEPHPPKQFKDFRTREEAEAHKRIVRLSPGVVATVDIVRPKEARVRKTIFQPGFDRVKRGQGMRLTR
jgi:hypothetical protein